MVQQSGDPLPAGILVVMGVSGSGKTTIGRLLATWLHWAFQEGDRLHPPANVAKMQSGHPLTDADRTPWLTAVAQRIDSWRGSGTHGVITCSALKKAYRRDIIGRRDGVGLVYLEGSQNLIARRLAARRGHFMPADLLDSQFAALEPPGPDEHPITVSVAGPADAIAEEILARLQTDNSIQGDPA